MRASILRHQLQASAARPVDDARVLRAVGEIMAASAPSHARFFESLVERRVLEMGADGAWVHLHGEAGSPALAVFSKSCHGDGGAGPSAASAAVHALLGDGTLYLDAHSALLPQAPWFAGFGAGTCVAHPIAGIPGTGDAAAGHLALVFRTRPERQEADNLREAVAQYEAVLQTAPVLINAFGDDGKCLLWNEECERRFGWSMEEVNAHPEPLALFYPDPVVLARVQASVSDEPSRLFREWHPQTRSGEVLSTIWSNTRMANGRVLNIGLDITERKRAEADIMDRLAVASRGGAGFTAMMLDLDHFKRVNDCHGHLESAPASRCSALATSRPPMCSSGRIWRCTRPSAGEGTRP